jgi:hypothetical protein
MHAAATDKSKVLRSEIVAVMQSLGNSIYKTIMWHMNSKGVFSNPEEIDIDAFYKNLQILLGPLTDEIMEMTLKQLKQKYGVRESEDLPSRATAYDKIQRWLGEIEG